MITKMNYLLLSTMMLAAIDSTFCSCCPCGKEKVEEGKEVDIDTLFPNLENNIHKNEELSQMRSVKRAKIKIERKKNVDIINAIVSNVNGLEEKNKPKVSDLLKLLLKNKAICYKCTQNTKAKNKIVLVYEASKKDNGNGYDLQSVLLKFSYCEQHQKTKKCQAKGCNNDGYYIMWCGHKICKNCLKSYAGKDNGFVVCGTCNAVCCIFDYIDHFGTHLWCNAKNNRHYVCFKGQDGENPYKQKDSSYDENTWVCSEHQDMGIDRSFSLYLYDCT